MRPIINTIMPNNIIQTTFCLATRWGREYGSCWSFLFVRISVYLFTLNDGLYIHRAYHNAKRTYFQPIFCPSGICRRTFYIYVAIGWIRYWPFSKKVSEESAVRACLVAFYSICNRFLANSSTIPPDWMTSRGATCNRPQRVSRPCLGEEVSAAPSSGPQSRLSAVWRCSVHIGPLARICRPRQLHHRFLLPNDLEDW